MATTSAPTAIGEDRPPSPSGSGRRARLALLALAVAVCVAGLVWWWRGSAPPDPFTVDGDLASVITCSAWTRPDDTVAPTAVGDIRIDWATVPAAEGQADSQEVSGGGFTFSTRASYPFPPVGHVLSVTVVDSQGRTVHTTLHQMWPGAGERFGQRSGSETGLNYAYDAATGAELQYSCTAS